MCFPLVWPPAGSACCELAGSFVGSARAQVQDKATPLNSPGASPTQVRLLLDDFDRNFRGLWEPADDAPRGGAPTRLKQSLNGSIYREIGSLSRARSLSKLNRLCSLD